VKRKLITGVLATALSLSMLSTAYASKITDLQNDQKNLEQQQDDAQGRIDDYKSQLEVVKAEIAVLQKKVEEINAIIAKTDQDIAKSENAIKQTDKEIADTEKKIADNEADLEKKKAVIAKNVRVMYEKGDSSYMEYLFSSADLSDFLYRFDALKDVASANQKLYDKVREILAQLAKDKADLDAKRATQVKQKETLETLRATQASQKQEQLKLVAQLVEKQDSIELNIDKEEAAINDMEAQARQMAAQIAAERKRLEEEAIRNNTKPPAPAVTGSGKYGLPLAPGSYYISSHYGYRTHPVTGLPSVLHKGIDLAGNLGTPIYAVDAGTVLYAGPASGFGHWIVIDHGNGIYSVYGHMYGNQIYVSPGQTVTKGQHIAGIGSDGGSTGNHLHFSFCDENFNYFDPETLINF
jgi:murein DD-endopeptidase MepM/ murein hydrolase activator NlpD